MSWIVSLRTSASAVRSQAKKDNLEELRTKQAATDAAHKSLRESYEAEIARLNTAQANRDKDLEARRQQVETLFDEINQTKSAQAAVITEFAEHKKMCLEMKADLLEQIDLLKGALKTTTAVAAAAQVVAAQPAAAAVATPPIQVEVVNPEPVVVSISTKPPAATLTPPPTGEKPG